MTYIFGGRFVKWTSGLIWGEEKGSMCLNSFGAWVSGFPLESNSLSYNHREGRHFMKIFHLCAVKTGERN